MIFFFFLKCNKMRFTRVNKCSNGKKIKVYLEKIEYCKKTNKKREYGRNRRNYYNKLKAK